MYPREYNDNSIKEIPKFKRNIIDEPIGGKTFIETNDDEKEPRPWQATREIF